jgi:hypothetical protein
VAAAENRPAGARSHPKGWEARARTAGVLDEFEHLGEQRNWWPEFVRLALGRETAVSEFDLKRL